MKGSLVKSLDTMAAVTNKQDRKAEVLDVDQVQVVAMTIDHLQKLAHFTIAFGGLDSSGKFWIDPDRRGNGAIITIREPLFSQLFCDVNGNPNFVFTQEALEDLFATHLIPGADKFAWTFDELEVHSKGKTIFKKEKTKQ
jgi:hypothetical protein